MPKIEVDAEEFEAFNADYKEMRQLAQQRGSEIIDLKSKLGEAQEMVDAHLESRNDALAQLAELIVERDTERRRLSQIFDLAQNVGRTTQDWQETDELVAKIKTLARVVEKSSS